MHQMVTTALNHASALSVPEGIFLADDVKIYKPAKQIYRSLLSKVNEERGDRAEYAGEDVWLVSG